MTSEWRVAVDTGGTFTDCLGIAPDGVRRRLKVLSSAALRLRVLGPGPTPGSLAVSGIDPALLPLLADCTATAYAGGDKNDFGGKADEAGNVCKGDKGTVEVAACVRAGDTAAGCLWVEPADWVAACAPGATLTLRSDEPAPVFAVRLLTGTPRHAPLPPLRLRLGTTLATNALLEGRGARVGLLVNDGWTDILRIGDQRRPDLFDPTARRPEPALAVALPVPVRRGAMGEVVEPLDREAVGPLLDALRQAGANAVAVSLLHAPAAPEDEAWLAERVRAAGFATVVTGGELSDLPHFVERTRTAVVEAALQPVLDAWLRRIESAVGEDRLLVMTSAGSLRRRRRYRAVDSLLSGPAGGVAGAARAGEAAGERALLLFDMGGTSTDAARWTGRPEWSPRSQVGGTSVAAPTLRIESVAAGGGSICRWVDGAPRVGPDSAGADPGPACYGAGGPLTLTDVDLLLGRLEPACFGVPLDLPAALRRLAETLGEATADPAQGRIADRLQAWLDVAHERMADALRAISVRQGYDARDHTLLAFGGAGGGHALAVAERLGVRRVLVPAEAGLLSAAGLLAARREALVVREVWRPWREVADSGELEAMLRAADAEARAQLVDEGVAPEGITVGERLLHLRVRGLEATLEVPAGPREEVEAVFARRFVEIFGRAPEGRPLELGRVEVRALGPDEPAAEETFATRPVAPAESRLAPLWTGRAWREVPRLDRAALRPGDGGAGPAVIANRTATLVVESGWRWVVGTAGSIRLDDARPRPRGLAALARSAQTELFAQRFRAIAEEMGEQLRRTAWSANIQDRCDFSCALLDRRGRLMVNAAHVPVHLGALGLALRTARRACPIGPGDVVVCNHPAFGGSHLPDLTVFAAVYDDAGELLGYVANRAHHAEIGGRRPGSMPPAATCLAEEGVVLAPQYLWRAGESCEEAVAAQLAGGPWPSRAVADNLADLRAQVASLRRGAETWRELARGEGAARVRRQLAALARRAEAARRRVTAGWPQGRRAAEDALDDGTPVSVAVAVDADGRLTIDFAGTGGVHRRSFNATPAIVRSAVLYVLRLWVGEDLPLNEGLLTGVRLRIPAGLLRPRFTGDPLRDPPVGAGNVETSQRLVEVLWRALGGGAESQGTMNNVIFGNDRYRHYETLGGGAGGSPRGPGGSAVQVHMTNTALTDPETLERRFPVRLRRLSVRRGSGGAGANPGGDGLIREWEFLEAAELSWLTQRRVRPPRGAEGGVDGRPGRQWLVRADGRRENLPAVGEATVEAGDLLVVETPGGGGWEALP